MEPWVLSWVGHALPMYCDFASFFGAQSNQENHVTPKFDML